MKERTLEFCRQFFDRHQDLLPLQENIRRVCETLLGVYRSGGKLLVCGNGGSCADGGHIVGELMKGFLLKRPLDPDTQGRLKEDFGKEGALLAEKLRENRPACRLQPDCPRAGNLPHSGISSGRLPFDLRGR